MFHACLLDALLLVVGVCFVGMTTHLVLFVYQRRHLLSDGLVVLHPRLVVKVLVES